MWIFKENITPCLQDLFGSVVVNSDAIIYAEHHCTFIFMFHHVRF